MDPVVIQCAVTGSQPPDPENRPNLPITPDRISDEAKAAYDAGAAVIHLHAREPDGTPTQDAAAFEDLVERVRERGCDAILNLSTGTAGGRATRDERYELLRLEPELASFDCGTINFGERIFEGDLPFLRRMAEAFREAGTAPELECFDTGYVGLALQLLEEGLLEKPLRVQLVVGIPGSGVPAKIEQVEHLRRWLPEGTPWSVCAPGAPSCRSTRIASSRAATCAPGRRPALSRSRRSWRATPTSWGGWCGSPASSAAPSPASKRRERSCT